MRYIFLILFFLTGFSLRDSCNELSSGSDSTGIAPSEIVTSSAATTFNWKNQSVLQSGKWYKISTSGKGIYKISHNDLIQWGISDPYNVNIYGAGGLRLREETEEPLYDDLPQLAVWHGRNGGNDCLFFYAPGFLEWEAAEDEDIFHHTINPYQSKGYFFITEDKGVSKAIEVLPQIQEDPTHSITSYNGYDLYEDEKFNLLRSGKQWFADKFINGTTKNYDFSFTDLVSSSDLSVLINAAARSSASSEIIVLANQSRIGEINFEPVNTSDVTSLYADEESSLYKLPDQSGEFDLTVKYSGNAANAEAWLDFIEVNYRRKLKLINNQALFFRDINSTGEGNILEFTIDNSSNGLKVWDVTDIFNVREVPLSLDGDKIKGRVRADILREYAAFDHEGNFPEPAFEGEVENQNIHGLSTPEFLIVTHPDFLNSARELADFHRSNDGMQVEVLSSQLVYNEFSSGRKDATGIRNFIKMFYDRHDGLKYVLLFGDGSYDNKKINSGSNSFIPTFQSDNSLNPVKSFVSDDYFVILDEGESVYQGTVDLGIGRIPAATSYQAETVVRKIKDYNSDEALGEWRNKVCFIADDEDGGLHLNDSEKLAGYLNENHGEFVTDKIYFDAFQQITGPGGESYPDVTDAVNKNVKEGVLILNYVGHANERFLADEKVLDVSHINSWSNRLKLPIFVTATCEFSRFDTDETSAGEYVLFNPSGGGIGLFSTTRLVYAYSNYLLSRSFYKFVFQKDENGEHYRMGEIMKLAKNNTVSSINKRNFSLLTDPALKLSYPAHKVVTTTINGMEAAGDADTLGALEHVTISGFIADEAGQKIDNFSGEIIPTVFDKPITVKTLGNAGQMPLDFKVQENIIYKGIVNVTDGEFSFSFVIPRDISYKSGEGKIIYYADNGETDAHGVFTNFFIGGSSSPVVDNTPPEIEVFLDSTDFVPGDVVDKNCLLIAFLSDENGINTVGSGIGHDITAIIDNNFSDVIILNEYYQSEPDDFTRGKVIFPLKNLSAGKHSLRVKAWDVANNSAEKEIYFEVSDDFYISEIRNTPNPLYDHTFFTFKHNQADASLDAIFEIFDLNGKRIDYFSTFVGSDGNLSNRVRWDIYSSDVKVQRGIYLYRITVKNSFGDITSGAGKMVVIR